MRRKSAKGKGQTNHVHNGHLDHNNVYRVHNSRLDHNNVYYVVVQFIVGVQTLVRHKRQHRAAPSRRGRAAYTDMDTEG